MTKKKTNTKEDKVEDKTSIKNNTFDLNNCLNELQYPEMFKSGLKSYIERNNIKITNQKDFDKILKNYSEVKL